MDTNENKIPVNRFDTSSPSDLCGLDTCLILAVACVRDLPLNTVFEVYIVPQYSLHGIHLVKKEIVRDFLGHTLFWRVDIFVLARPKIKVMDKEILHDGFRIIINPSYIDLYTF
jgi:hypothetical protein